MLAKYPSSSGGESLKVALLGQVSATRANFKHTGDHDLFRGSGKHFSFLSKSQGEKKLTFRLKKMLSHAMLIYLSLYQS